MITERRGVVYAITGGVWLMVAIYAVLHDQYLVRIAPEHFTSYHAPVWGLSEAKAIAAAWAFKASVLPGLGLGLVAAYVGRNGLRRKVGVKAIFVGAGVVIVLTEVVAAGSGFWAYKTGGVLYPEGWYPVLSDGIRVTQTIQLSAYLAAFFWSGLWLFGIRWWRCREEARGRSKAD